MDANECVVLIHCPDGVGPSCEAGLRALEDLGHPVRRLYHHPSPDVGRSLLADSALADGFPELLWISPDITFRPEDVGVLRSHGLPITCGLAPDPSTRGFSCEFLPGTRSVTFGEGGGPVEVRFAGFDFMLTRREIFGQIRKKLGLPLCDRGPGPAMTPWFQPLVVGDADPRFLCEDHSFCERARQCGFAVIADSSIRLNRSFVQEYGWDRVLATGPGVASIRYEPLPASTTTPSPVAEAMRRAGRKRPTPTPWQSSREAQPDPAPLPDRASFRGEACPLPAGFPIIKAYIFTYPKNLPSFEQTMADFRLSDWSEDPIVFVQPGDWPAGVESASRTYRRVLEHAAEAGCDYALILEDDVRIARSLRRNLMAIPLIYRDQCDFLSLFIPDLIADPWERSEWHLGYRLAKPRYAGPNELWMKGRLWGSQAYLLSRRLVLAALERWDHLNLGQDSRIVSVCGELRLPMWYTAPCLVEHAPLRSAFSTPSAHAPDFDPDFLLRPRAGFQPPEAIPGSLGDVEGRLLWEIAEGRVVLELGTGSGRSTVCLAQSARRLVTISDGEQSEAAEWTRRYGLSDRVDFLQGGEWATQRAASAGFDMAVVNSNRDDVSIRRGIDSALAALKPGGMLVFRDYPDPLWPAVRAIVDEHARRLGWKRVRQEGYCGVFRG